jgi:hypothetical protein
MPVWLRKYIFNTLNEVKESEKQQIERIKQQNRPKKR